MENSEQFEKELAELKALLSDPDFEPRPLAGSEALEPQSSEENPLPTEELSSQQEHPEEKKAEKKDVEKKEDKAILWQKNLLLWMHDLVYLLAVMILISPLLLRIVVVEGTSMNGTLLDGDYLVVLSNSIYREPEFCDIVVISKESFDEGAPIVKRVIATEGQWVNIDFNLGIVYVGNSKEDMQPLSEPYTLTGTTTQEGMTFPLQVPADSIFVLGDNRAVSKDSRHPDIGIVAKEEVLGKVVFLFLPGTNGKDIYGNPNEPRDWHRIGVVD